MRTINLNIVSLNVILSTGLIICIILFTGPFSMGDNELPKCRNDVQIKKIQGVKTLVLERPLDKHLLHFDDQSYYLMINKNHDVVFAGKHSQTIITSLKHKNGKPAYFIEIDWFGDSNQDCKLDLVLWKKLGLYMGSQESSPDSHEKERTNEKLQVLSQPTLKNPYLIQSLGKY